MRYRRRPIEVEAVQITDEWFDGEHPNPLHPISKKVEMVIIDPVKRRVEIRKTFEDTMIGNVGDWIITDINGETYPIKDFVFKKTYEPV